MLFRSTVEEQREEWPEVLRRLAAAGSALPPLLLNWSSDVPELYRAAHKLGLRIGEDLRVMAADNTIQGHRLSLPSLSCVEIPYVRMGEESVRCILQQLEHRKDQQPHKIWLPAILRAGESA